MARWCGGRRGQKVGPLPASHSIVVRNSPHHPPPGLVMNSQREVGQKPKAVLRGDPHLSVADRCESGLKNSCGLLSDSFLRARARACVEVRKLALAVAVTVAPAGRPAGLDALRCEGIEASRLLNHRVLCNPMSVGVSPRCPGMPGHRGLPPTNSYGTEHPDALRGVGF